MGIKYTNSEKYRAESFRTIAFALWTPPALGILDAYLKGFKDDGLFAWHLLFGLLFTIAGLFFMSKGHMIEVRMDTEESLLCMNQY